MVVMDLMLPQLLLIVQMKMFLKLIEKEKARSNLYINLNLILDLFRITKCIVKL